MISHYQYSYQIKTLNCILKYMCQLINLQDIEYYLATPCKFLIALIQKNKFVKTLCLKLKKSYRLRVL